MAEIKNTFVLGKMNKDLDERLINSGEYRDALNVLIDSSEGAQVGSVQNSLGNTKIIDLASLSGTTISNARTVGTVKHEALNLIYWFVASDNFDGIYEYNQITGNAVRVLQSQKSTPTTPSKLNFSKEYLITGVNFIDGFLYWTDNYNPPRKINISRAKSYFIDDSKIDDDINVILAPPLNSPKIILTSDASEDSNNMDEKFIYFSYRFKYVDGQYSALSPFSAVAFGPSSQGFDYDKGNNIAMSNVYNQAEIFFETGGRNVTDIELLFRDSRSLNVSIIESFNKDKNNFNDYTVQSFLFKNNKLYAPITSDQVTRLFDNVPLLAKAQDFVGNRLMYGNYTQFFDIKDTDETDIKIDLNLKIGELTTTSNEIPVSTFRSDRDYEIGIEYLDDYGRSSTVLTSPNNTVYIGPQFSVTGNSLQVSVKNNPPYWASYFRFLIKQNKGSYYNIFPLTFYTEGFSVYFKAQKTDVDKIKVGDYLIAKAKPGGPTLSNKKYKILEFESKAANFLGGGELAGLYFKISVDSTYEFDDSLIEKINNYGYGAGITKKGTDKKNSANFKGENGASIDSAGGVKYTEKVIHYGNGSPNAVTAIVPTGTSFCWRHTIIITSPTTYAVYSKDIERDNTSLGVLVKQGTITLNQYIDIDNPDIGLGVYTNLRVRFNQNSLETNDRYIVNHRSSVKTYTYGNAATTWDNKAVINLHPSNTNTAIKKGALITLTVVRDRLNNYVDTTEQTFPPSPSDYLNIEEWWYESGAFKLFNFYTSGQTNIGSRAVKFTRGYVGLSSGQNADWSNNFITQTPAVNDLLTRPLNMLIISSVSESSTKEQPQLLVKFSLAQSDNTMVFETVGNSIDNDIFHELSTTYRIEDNLHKVLWSYADYTTSGGRTNLGQLVPGTLPTAADVPHKFSVGETIYVTSDDDANMPSGSYIVYEVPDAYNVVIDFTFPGSGPVTGGGISYSSADQDQDATNPLRVNLNNTGTVNTDFNGWCFGNGLESNRILDDWNEAEAEYSVRVNSFVEDYRERISENAICYSGIYGENTGIDRLNEFNLSLANFKYLDRDFGSIQVLHARDNDLLVFQQDKISKVLYGKNLLFDAVGGGQVASIPEVLGNQISYPSEFGISNNPESFASWGNDIYFTDARRGDVLKLSGDSLSQISNNGMNDYFRDVMKSTPNNQKLGGFDPYLSMYTLSFNNFSVSPCFLKLNRLRLNYPKTSKSGKMFDIITFVDWTVELVDAGFGTDWVSINTDVSGNGNSLVSASTSTNNTGARRQVNFVVTYCETQTQTFRLYQGTTDGLVITTAVFTNPITKKENFEYGSY